MAIIVTTSHYIGIAIGGVLLVAVSFFIRKKMKGGVKVYAKVEYPKEETGRDGGPGGYRRFGRGRDSGGIIAEQIGWPDEELREEDDRDVIPDKYVYPSSESGTVQEARYNNVEQPRRKVRRHKIIRRRTRS